MKVMQINCVYDYGSTGKIVKDIHIGLLSRGIDSVVLYGRREKIKERNIYKVCTELEAKSWNVLSKFNGRPFEVSPIGTALLIQRIKNERPDVVHLQCINGYFVNIYRLVEWLKDNHIPTVLTLHAEFMYTGGCAHAIDCNQWSSPEGCGHPICPRYHSELKSLFGDPSSYNWKRMKKAFEGFRDNLIVASVSPWLMERAQRSPILEGKNHCVVLNGLDTNVFQLYDTQDLRKKHDCIGKRVVFHATPGFSADPMHIKGGYYVIELAKRMPEVQFIVAGDCVGEVTVPPNIILLGKITDQRLLAQYYSMADVTLLTSKRETFSMVCAESLCCGTPVVGFEAGGPEQISLPKYSFFVEDSNLDGLYREMQRFNGCDKEKISKCAEKVYAKDTMVEEYMKLYIGVCLKKFPVIKDNTGFVTRTGKCLTI